MISLKFPGSTKKNIKCRISSLFTSLPVSVPKYLKYLLGVPSANEKVTVGCLKEPGHDLVGINRSQSVLFLFSVNYLEKSILENSQYENVK